MTGAVEQAQSRARKLYRGKHFRNAYVRGAASAMNGLSIDACPYPPDPNKTWGGAWRRAWILGYQSVRR